MRKLIAALSLVTIITTELLVSEAAATTYNYVGQPMTEVSGCFFFCQSIGGLTGSVTFNFDTSAFSGTLSLAQGDTAYLYGFGHYFSFPGYSPPPGVYGQANILSGFFSLSNGLITSWNLFGSTYQQNCGLGPGCATGSAGVATSAFEDSLGFFDRYVPGFSQNFIGLAGGWTGPILIAAIPEASTWAMLLIGFAGIGFVSYRAKSLRERLMDPTPLTP